MSENISLAPKFKKDVMQEEIENCRYSVSYSNGFLKVIVSSFENGDDIQQSYIYQIIINNVLIKHEEQGVKSLQDAANKAEQYLNVLYNLLKNLGFKLAYC